MGLKGELVRLAHAKPELREYIIPVLRQHRQASSLASMPMKGIFRKLSATWPEVKAAQLAMKWLKSGANPTTYVKARFWDPRTEQKVGTIEMTFPLELENSFGKEQNWNYEDWRGEVVAKVKLKWELGGPKPILTAFWVKGGRIIFTPSTTPKATPRQIVAALATQNPKWLDPRKFEEAKYYREEKINDWSSD